MSLRGKFFLILISSVLGVIVTSCSAKDETFPVIPKPTSHVDRVPTVGFEEVTNAPDGEYVTLTEYIDPKYLCMDLSPTQRNLCTTALVNANYQPFHIIEIRLRVCSETLRRNCIVFPFDSDNVDFREVYVLDNLGRTIDFDGERLIEAPNTWTAESVPLKLTGRVTVIDGKGKLIDPIDRIESASWFR